MGCKTRPVKPLKVVPFLFTDSLKLHFVDTCARSARKISMCTFYYHNSMISLVKWTDRANQNQHDSQFDQLLSCTALSWVNIVFCHIYFILGGISGGMASGWEGGNAPPPSFPLWLRHWYYRLLDYAIFLLKSFFHWNIYIIKMYDYF